MLGLSLSALAGSVIINLRAGVRLALFRPVERSSFRFGPAPLAAMWATALLTHCVIQLAFVWPVGSVSPWGTGYLLAAYFSGLVALHLGAILIGRGRQSGRLQVMVISTLPLTHLATLGITMGIMHDLLPPEAALAIYALFGLPLIAAGRGTSLLGRRALPHGLIPAAALAGAITFSAAFLVPFPVFEQAFDESEDAATADWKPIDIESVYYAQPALLDAQLAGLRAGQPGEVELYAMLLAYYPHERVFLREVESAGTIIESGFGAEGRIVRLANSRAEPGRYPLANRRNLESGLARLSQVMGEEDVLLLYLTSHGSKELLSAGYWELGTADLDAEALALALANSGIGNAVVIVSACKSGSFVPWLAAPDRLIITASSAERNSFGCSDANEWTRFGDAFFNQALRSTQDFRVAFDIAAALVAEWERADGREASQPQIALGPEIEPVLEQLAATAARR
jgi:hypothetical protein